MIIRSRSAEARELGLPVNTAMPQDMLDLMALFPQPVRTSTGVEFGPRRAPAVMLARHRSRAGGTEAPRSLPAAFARRAESISPQTIILGLSRHPALRAAARACAGRYAAGAGASRLLRGHHGGARRAGRIRSAIFRQRRVRCFSAAAISPIWRCSARCWNVRTRSCSMKTSMPA